MTDFMTVLGNLTLAASLAVLLVLAVRVLLARLPKRYLTFLWLPVFFRAVCPVSFQSPFSLYRILNGVPGFHSTGGRMTFTLAGYQSARITAVLERIGSALSDGKGAAAVNAATVTEAGAEVILENILFGIWLGGVTVVLLYGLFSWLRLRRKTALAVKLEEGVYESDWIGSAFLMGFFRPRIYLPAGLTSEERILVLTHEKTHKRRQDSRVKLLAWLVCVVHWFNPLLWLAFILLARDMEEMACDEQVLEQLGTEEKKRYSTFLLKLSAPGAFLTGTPVAFGENSVKSRIKNILRYKKTRAGIAAAAVALVAGAAWFCLSNPASTFDEDIIGGADGPTSIFLAGKLSGGDDTASFVSGENLKLGGDEEKIYEVVKTFAEAAGNRDADTVWELLSPVLQHSDDLGIQVLEDGTKTMGVSSPFPADGPTISLSIGDGSADAEITYPSMTSDPLWWSWKDYITLEKNGDTYRVTAWKTKYYDDITSAAEFEEAYRMWQPDYLKPTDETADLDSSFASYLVKNDVAESYYGEAFSTPVKALETTLHVSGGIGKTEDADGGDVWVNYEFPDGTIRVRMTQPGIDEGSRIWVPKEIPMG